MADDIRSRIENLIHGSKVMLFMKGTKQFPACGFSHAVVQILKKEGASFDTHNILADPEVRQGLKEFSNWPTYPQLYIDGKFVGGCDIVTEMHQSGELATHLSAAGAASKLPSGGSGAVGQ
jgi:monothiol glutaredoxin